MELIYGRPAVDPYRSKCHGKPTAAWCLATFGDLAVDHTHVCNVDVYRQADHVHRCRCGETDATDPRR